MKVVDAYLAAFKKTPLLMLVGGGDCLKYACAHGTGWRCRLPWATWAGSHEAGATCYTPTLSKSRSARHLEDGSVAWETCWDMRKWVSEGWSLRYIFNYALACHASVINNKSAPLPSRAMFGPKSNDSCAGSATALFSRN